MRTYIYAHTYVQVSTSEMSMYASELLNTAVHIRDSGGGGKLARIVAQKAREISEILVGKSNDPTAVAIAVKVKGFLAEMESGGGDANYDDLARKGMCVCMYVCMHACKYV